VYDPERDIDKVARGEGRSLIYGKMMGVVPLPGAVGKDKEAGVEEARESDAKVSSDSDEDQSEDTSEEDGEGEEGTKEGFVERKPRGHRHEDRDDKKARKQAVKEETREKRKHKIPKAEKKKMIKKTRG